MAWGVAFPFAPRVSGAALASSRACPGLRLKLLRNPLNACPKRRFREGAGQTYQAKAPIVLASGLAIEATSPVSATSQAVGLANTKATGVMNAEVLSLSIEPSSMGFEANLSDATAGTHTLAQTDVGLVYPVTKDTATGNWYLDAASASSEGGFVVGYRDPIGTVDARVYFRFTCGCIQGCEPVPLT